MEGKGPHMICSVNTIHQTHITSVQAVLGCPLLTPLDVENVYHNTHDGCADWTQCCPTIDYELLKSGVRLFSSPHVFSSKLTSCNTSPCSSILLEFFLISTCFANAVIVINFLQPNLGQISNYYLTVCLHFFNSFILNINIKVFYEARE